MNNRNLEKLAQTDFTKRFCEKYNFSVKVVKGQLVFFNNCIVINIYGYTVEKILYFDFFSNDYKFYEDSDVLLNKVGFDKPFLMETYNYYKGIHTTNLTDSPNGNNLQATINAEVYYFTYITAFDKFFSHILNCEFPEFISYLRDATQARTDGMNILMDSNAEV